MESKQVAPGIVEYGNMKLPDDLPQIAIVAQAKPQEAHYTVISMALFYSMVKKCLAFETMKQAVKKKEETENGNTGTATEEKKTEA